MIPLKDNIPTSRFPIVTVLLIVANLVVFGWQLHFSSSDYSNAAYRAAGGLRAGPGTLEYGAIPYRLTHPGKDCAVGVTSSQRHQRRRGLPGDTAGTRRQRQLAGARRAVRSQLDAPPWWATVFTSMFMHGGILHIAFNMLFLWIFGNNVEDSMGRPRFLLFYLLAGLGRGVRAGALVESTPPCRRSARAARSRGCSAATCSCYPRARVLTLIFIIFFVTLIEIPAVIMLGIWFVLQFLPAIGQVGTGRGLGRRRRVLGPRRRIRLRPGGDQAVREPPARDRAPGMRSAFLIVALVFCLAFGGMTAAVAAQSGFDIFTRRRRSGSSR